MARAQPGKLDWTVDRRARLFAGLLRLLGLNMTKVPNRNPVEAVNDLGEGRRPGVHDGAGDRAAAAAGGQDRDHGNRGQHERADRCAMWPR